ncbi:hypothetical protein BV25DRAFT_1922069 [Artomyces pyxidatus]|uniref:Uncharacterized protein n=1 Tax=Artomyces pyxidatus TaxID=48021 RepID=A0ACB8SHE6_9AGAM|nr:hypothetical protein BV25DRAFT_1922069 [Artomyces pyxidatus]
MSDSEGDDFSNEYRRPNARTGAQGGVDVVSEIQRAIQSGQLQVSELATMLGLGAMNIGTLGGSEADRALNPGSRTMAPKPAGSQATSLSQDNLRQAAALKGKGANRSVSNAQRPISGPSAPPTAASHSAPPAAPSQPSPRGDLAIIMKDLEDAVTRKSLDDIIRKFGKKFAVMYEPWVELEVFGKPRPNLDHFDLERYNDKHMRLLGIIADLYDCIPSKLHHDLEHYPEFSVHFLKGMKQARSENISRLRQVAHKIFPSADPKYYDVDFDRGNVPELQALLKTNPKSSKFSKIPPVLFPQNNINSRKIFRTPTLAKASS